MAVNEAVAHILYWTGSGATIIDLFSFLFTESVDVTLVSPQATQLSIHFCEGKLVPP